MLTDIKPRDRVREESGIASTIWTDTATPSQIQVGDTVKLENYPIVVVLQKQDLGNKFYFLVLENTSRGKAEWLLPKEEPAPAPVPANKPAARSDRKQAPALNKRLKGEPQAKSDSEPTPQSDRIEVSWNFQQTGGETKDLETNRRARFVVVDAADRWLISNIHQALDPHIVSNLEREPVKVGSETTLPHTAAVLAAIPEKSNSSNKVKPVGTASWPTPLAPSAPAPTKSKPAPREPIEAKPFTIAPVTQKKSPEKKSAARTGEERMPVAAISAKTVAKRQTQKSALSGQTTAPQYKRKQPATEIDELVARATTVRIFYTELPHVFKLQTDYGTEHTGSVLVNGRVTDTTEASKNGNYNNRCCLALKLALKGVRGFEIEGTPPAGCNGTVESLHKAIAAYWQETQRYHCIGFSPQQWVWVASELGLCPKPQQEPEPHPEQAEKYPGLEVWADSNCWKASLGSSYIGSFWRAGNGQWVAQPYLGRPIRRRFDSELEAINALINAWEFAQEERAKEPHIGPATCTAQEWEAARAKVPPGFVYDGNRWRDENYGFTNLPEFARMMTLRELAIVTGRVTVEPGKLTQPEIPRANPREMASFFSTFEIR